MEYLSNGFISFKWDLFSDITCKLRFFFYFHSESLSQYLLLWLTLERLLALYHPFRVRSFATKHNGQIILSVLTTLSLIIAAPALYHFKLQTHPTTLGAIICKGVYQNTAEVIISILFMCILCEFLPVITVLVCTILLGIKIHKLSRMRTPVRVAFRNFEANSTSTAKFLTTPNASSTRVQRIESVSRYINESNTRSNNASQRERIDFNLSRSIYMLALLELIMALLAISIWIVLAIIEFVGGSKELIAQIYFAGILVNDFIISFVSGIFTFII